MKYILHCSMDCSLFTSMHSDTVIHDYVSNRHSPLLHYCVSIAINNKNDNCPIPNCDAHTFSCNKYFTALRFKKFQKSILCIAILLKFWLIMQLYSGGKYVLSVTKIRQHSRCTVSNLVVKGHGDLTKHVFSHNPKNQVLFMTKHHKKI